MIHKFDLQKKYIKALAQFIAPKNDIRYYLNGILLEFDSETSGCAVATNGHLLACFRLHAEKGHKFPVGKTLILPRELAMEFKKEGINSASITYDDESQVIRANFFPRVVEMKAIEGKFPDWRRAMPKDISGTAGQYNPRYLKSFSDLAFAVTLKSDISLAQNGLNGALVGIPRLGADFIGAIMPLRDEAPVMLPDWAKVIAPT